jgi:hypothetical protein
VNPSIDAPRDASGFQEETQKAFWQGGREIDRITSGILKIREVDPGCRREMLDDRSLYLLI